MLYEININKARKEGYAEGREEGILEGKKETFLESIKNIMNSLGLSAEQAMDIQKIPDKDRDYYRSRL